MIVLFRSRRNRQFYFRVVARNGRTVAASEGYTTRRARKAGYKALCRIMGNNSVRVRDLG